MDKTKRKIEEMQQAVDARADLNDVFESHGEHMFHIGFKMGVLIASLLVSELSDGYDSDMIARYLHTNVDDLWGRYQGDFE